MAATTRECRGAGTRADAAAGLQTNGDVYITNMTFQGAGTNSRAIELSPENGASPALWLQGAPPAPTALLYCHAARRLCVMSVRSAYRVASPDLLSRVLARL